jgi:hypothetical protein
MGFKYIKHFDGGTEINCEKSEMNKYQLNNVVCLHGKTKSPG